MVSISMLFAVLLVVTGLGAFEYRRHLHNLNKIPIRIHVNGTRGKSSVTRLIAAGLSAGGIKVFAKTTGTVPRVITPEGDEFAVYRPSSPNIIEQLRVVDFASHNGAEALVIECMALQPSYQSLCETKFVKSTIGVITNARADHLDVMGPYEVDVAKALLGTTPVKGTLFTCEEDYVELFNYAGTDRGTSVVIVGNEISKKIPDEYMEGFTYIEHKENVALALAVCEKAGVTPEIAIKGMHKVFPDAGAMSEYRIEWFGRKIMFVNGFAANDPESTEMIWNMAFERNPQISKSIMIINCRADRPERSDQIGNSVSGWKRADIYLVVGTGTYVFVKAAVHSGVQASKIINVEDEDASKIFEKIIELSNGETLVMGVCNIKGAGLELVKYFANRTYK
ncbi:MAG TPA: poly-gamma-glutamate synthase PgsB [bacterium]|nr:poly-gamma-glutamate synthase PgsB [bacterium]HPS30672.1 poly-gamma-glutamate synthase PgsB [bacterium]